MEFNVRSISKFSGYSRWTFTLCCYAISLLSVSLSQTHSWMQWEGLGHIKLTIENSKAFQRNRTRPCFEYSIFTNCFIFTPLSLIFITNRLLLAYRNCGTWDFQIINIHSSYSSIIRAIAFYIFLHTLYIHLSCVDEFFMFLCIFLSWICRDDWKTAIGDEVCEIFIMVWRILLPSLRLLSARV